MLYRAVRSGTIDRAEADRRLAFVRAMRIRLLGDRVLQQVAWQIAERLGWPDTLDAEYVALTRLQGDALVTLDSEFARTVEGVVEVAPVEALL
jgi:predicted nucleic acid-binding protein